MNSLADYKQDVETIKQFLREFSYVDENDQVATKYMPILTKIANREQIALTVDLNDLEQFDQGLSERVANNTLNYTELFCEALDDILPPLRSPDLQARDVMDVFIEQRSTNIRAQVPESSNFRRPNTQMGASNNLTADLSKNKNIEEVEGQYPPGLNRRVEVFFKPVSLSSIPIRSVLCEHVGKLVSVRGIVTRVSDVKPKISIVTYTCDQCGSETFQPVSGLSYTPLFECTTSACKLAKGVSKLTSQVRGSKFINFQDIKLQEHSDQVPTGGIPRTMTVVAHGQQTGKCSAGDHVSVSGVFLPYSRSSRAGGLLADTYLDAHYITKMNKTEDDELNDQPLTIEEAKVLMDTHTNFFHKLSNSIAPEIFGYKDLKKALLLLLIGGVDRDLGIKIRGNINICLMGDPGVAKSQLLSFIDRLASRSQYTSGRGSSGVGLTAAVLKDSITNELVLEGGALVLADQGICCIDEFDKMLDADRTAIHEVMEQQTVSIAKAGIMTSLNARVSILAAANPAFGKYLSSRSIADNLQLPPALLSRFDLLWLIRDLPEKGKDGHLANHVLQNHQNNAENTTHNEDVIDLKLVRRYISLCKTKQPVIPESLSQILEDMYLRIRRNDRATRLINRTEEGTAKDNSLFTSPRSLLAIIRLSTALARMRLADEVNVGDIEEALRLYDCSRESIIIEDREESYKSKIADVLIKLKTKYSNSIPAKEARDKILKVCKITEEQLDVAFKEMKEIISYDPEEDTYTYT